MNQKSVTLNWSSPSPGSFDVAQTRINIGGRGWENVGASGSRVVNTAGYDETVAIQVQTFNSLGTGSPVAQASAKSGRIGQWTTTMVTDTGLVRSCSYTLGGSNYRPNPYFDCDGVAGNNPPWFYVASQDTIVVKCYVVQNDNWSGGPDQPYYRVESGSGRNVGRYIIASHTKLGQPGSHGIPHC